MKKLLLWKKKKKPVKRMTKQATEWEEMFANYAFNKGLVWETKNSKTQ